MAVTTVVPNDEGTLLELTVQPTGGANLHWDKVDEGISGADDGSTTLVSTGNNTLVDFVQITDMPGDFDVAVDVTLEMRTQITGVVDDTASCEAKIYETNEVTVIPAASTATKVGDHTWESNSGSTDADTENAATWDTRKVRLAAIRSNSGMPDDITLEFTAVEVVINYDVTAGGGDGTDMPWPEISQRHPISVGVVASGPTPGTARS